MEEYKKLDMDELHKKKSKIISMEEALKDVEPFITFNDEFILQSLKQSGKRLKELLGITEEDIDRAIKEFRKGY